MLTHFNSKKLILRLQKAAYNCTFA